MNLNKPSLLLVIDLINESNKQSGKTLTGENIVFGSPEQNKPPAEKNTHLFVDSKEGGGYYNNVYVDYDRVSLKNLFQGDPVVLDVKNPQRVKDLLPRLNQKYSLQLTDEDIIDEELPLGATTCEIITSPLSLCYIDELTVQIGFELAEYTIQLETGEPITTEAGNPIYLESNTREKTS